MAIELLVITGFLVNVRSLMLNFKAFLKVLNLFNEEAMIKSSFNLTVWKSLKPSLNHAVDCLAKQALIEKDNLQVFDPSPTMVRPFIDMDKSKGGPSTQNVSM
ncbi:hypothetical protein Goshw_004652 [Gossypium schwendimanii]|uniref:Uncharacterized protein n=2 Tax=Gossypium TaxID=3633 RepID=A0A7J9LET9_GOSSC|nr:hypothetical protein [Gossypium schwendimanii]